MLSETSLKLWLLASHTHLFAGVKASYLNPGQLQDGCDFIKNVDHETIDFACMHMYQDLWPEESIQARAHDDLDGRFEVMRCFRLAGCVLFSHAMDLPP